MTCSLGYPLRWIILVLLGLLIYGQTFSFDFVFDDHIFVVTNPFIKNFSNFHLMWRAFPLTRFVAMYSFALNYSLNQFHPWGYHVFNFIVHLVCVGLVWALAGLILRTVGWLPSEDRLRQELPFIIALLFLVHPGQTQAVTYITQRFESLATMFYLGTIYAYLRGRLAGGRKGAAFLGLAVALAALGLLTKEVAVTIPLMVLAVEWILLRTRFSWKLCVIAVIGAVALYLLFSRMVHDNLRVLVQSVPSESHDGDLLTPARYLLTQARVLLTFLRILVLPVHQNLDYDYPESTGILTPPLTLLGLAMEGLLAVLVVRLRRQQAPIAFGIAWILITFSINLVPRANVIFEHKLYLISFGFFLAGASALSMLAVNRLTLIKVAACLVLALSFAGYQRNRVWASELLLWQDNIRKSPNKARVNASLGRIYGTLGRYEDAIACLTRAIALKPDVITYENRGVVYSLQGRMNEALADFSRSLAMEPDYFLTYTKRAWVYSAQHNYAAAMADLNHAAILDPYYADTYVERGMLWMSLGRQQEALRDFETVLSLDPFNYDILLKAGYIHYMMGRYDLALQAFSRAQRVEPRGREAAQYKAYCLAKLGQSNR